MPSKEIYSFLIDRAPLLEAHHKELNEKRGFSDKTIARFKLKSCGKHFLELEAELSSKFQESNLIASGVFLNDGKQSRINPVLTEERVLIPYLDQNGAYYIRPHKLGLAGIPVEIYQTLNLAENPGEIVLTEGEFKAVAGMQYGIPTIAVPGISSFSEAHFPRLVKLLNDFKIRKVTVLFDNEVKDNPAFPDRYKENPTDRYDTQFYAYYMAKKLDTEGFESRIAWLPDGWREGGKIDIDGAAAQGRTAGDIKKIIFDAKSHNIYLNDLAGEAKQIILRKNSQKRHRSHVAKEFGHYVATRRRGKTEWTEIISNFLIKIIATHETPEGIIREVVFVNEFGEHSTSFSLPPESMSGTDAFSTFCLGRGNFVWRGSKEDLSTIWESEFLMMDEGRRISEPDHIGWVERDKIWLFGNVAIRQDGTEIRPDKNHIFWFEKKGIKPIPLGVTTGKTTISEGVPYLSLQSCHINEIKQRLSESIGANPASLCLGWVSAIPFLEEVFDLYGCFPFLFITGRRGSGKSTVAEWLMNFFGLENAGKMAADTTPVGCQRYLSYYSSLPVFLDEYRNTKQIKYKDGFFRNAYNRQSAGKGIKADFGVREAKIRGTLLFSGEETPEDNALLTRSIVAIVSEKNRTTNHFDWFQKYRTRFSSHFLDLLKRRNTLIEPFFKILKEAKEHFLSSGIDDRLAINYAIVAAGYATAFGEDDIDFAKFMTGETQRVKEEYQDEQAVNIFLEDLIAIKTRGMINGDYWAIDDHKIYLYFHGLYSVWSEHFRRTRGVEPFKASAIRDYLKEEPGFVGSNFTKKINGQPKKCSVFDIQKSCETVKMLVGVDL
jgi:DNA primase